MESQQCDRLVRALGQGTSRRGALGVVVGALALLGAGRLPDARAAQEATPLAAPDASPVALPPLVQQWIAAFDAGDGQALATLYAPDGVYEDVTQPTLYGRQAIAAFIDQLAMQQKDISVQPRAIHLTNDSAVLEYAWSSTIVQTGQPIALRGDIVFAFADDHIRRSADYYDLPPALEGTPAA
jgi:steroid delta-isomerase-like uncharacterized protein